MPSHAKPCQAKNKKKNQKKKLLSKFCWKIGNTFRVVAKKAMQINPSNWDVNLFQLNSTQLNPKLNSTQVNSTHSATPPPLHSNNKQNKTEGKPKKHKVSFLHLLFANEHTKSTRAALSLCLSLYLSLSLLLVRALHHTQHSTHIHTTRTIPHRTPNKMETHHTR